MPLARPVPVHLVYFTAWPDAEGRIPTRDFNQTPMGSAATGEAAFFEHEPSLLLLASQAGSYITGSTIEVDGGHLVSSL